MTEVIEWIALRRAHEGGVKKVNTTYTSWGRPVPCYLPGVFDALTEAGLLFLIEIDGSARLMPTLDGRTRFSVLNRVLSRL
ncbi:MAG: hypothetical protein ACRDTE_18965 [Pseudonocardiaceae bacterium]